MVQNQLVVLDSFVPLLAAGLGNFVEGYALHTSRRTVGAATRGGVGEFRGGLRSPHLL